MYYTIQENTLLISDNRCSLEKFYGNVLELPQDYDDLKYIVIDNELVINSNYEEEKARRERERISHLRCTKRVLALILQELGITYSQLKSLIDSNPQAQLEWDLCVELERSNPLLDLVGAELGLNSVDIDNIFKYANGEISTIEREVTNE